MPTRVKAASQQLEWYICPNKADRGQLAVQKEKNGLNRSQDAIHLSKVSRPSQSQQQDLQKTAAAAAAAALDNEKRNKRTFNTHSPLPPSLPSPLSGGNHTKN